MREKDGWKVKKGWLRDEAVHGVTMGAIRRMALRGGVKRISGLVYEDTRGVLGVFLENSYPRRSHVRGARDAPHGHRDGRRLGRKKLCLHALRTFTFAEMSQAQGATRARISQRTDTKVCQTFAWAPLTAVCCCQQGEQDPLLGVPRIARPNAPVIAAPRLLCSARASYSAGAKQRPR
jgi:hypothetical protein